MQNILNGAGVLQTFSQFATGTGATIIVPTATNVRGVIVYYTSWKWVLAAVASSITSRLLLTGGSVFNGIFDDNGAGGVVNIPSLIHHQNVIQIPAGVDLSVDHIIAGTVRAQVQVGFRVL